MARRPSSSQLQQGTAEGILTNPADDYVARFGEDVDMTKVITAETVMKKTATMAYLGTDGPKAALRKMEKAAISSIFVGDHGRLGVIVVGWLLSKLAETTQGEKVGSPDRQD